MKLNISEAFNRLTSSTINSIQEAHHSLIAQSSSYQVINSALSSIKTNVFNPIKHECIKNCGRIKILSGFTLNVDEKTKQKLAAFYEEAKKSPTSLDASFNNDDFESFEPGDLHNLIITTKLCSEAFGKTNNYLSDWDYRKSKTSSEPSELKIVIEEIFTKASQGKMTCETAVKEIKRGYAKQAKIDDFEIGGYRNIIENAPMADVVFNRMLKQKESEFHANRLSNIEEGS
jgi:hypothetical protein